MGQFSAQFNTQNTFSSYTYLFKETFLMEDFYL